MADKEKLRFSRSVGKFGSPEDTRSHIEQDEYSITSSGASLEDSMFRDRDSVEYTRAKCTNTNAESDTCTSPCSLSTDELEIMRKQGAIPKHFRKALPPRPGPPPSEEVSLENCEEDGSKKNSSIASSIVVPRTEVDIQIVVKKSCELIDSLKEKRQPVDFIVLLEPSKIKPRGGKYEEKSEFIRTGELKKRNKAGAVYKVKDNQTHEEHCLKTVRLSSFNVQELQCLVDLRHSCYVPLLLMFRIRDVAVDLHMELLTNSFTMEQIIQEKVCELGDLGKPFAYYILLEMLMAVSVMQKKCLHGDIHDRNIMMQVLGSENLALKWIDFGDAFQIKNAEDLTCEIKMVMSIFSAVFDKICFNDVDDWRESLDQLVDFDVSAKNPFQPKDLFNTVEERFNGSLKDLSMTKPEFLRQVVAVLSTEKSDDGAITREEDDYIEFDEGKITALRGEEEDTNRENMKHLEEDNGSAPQELFPKPAL